MAELLSAADRALPHLTVDTQVGGSKIVFMAREQVKVERAEIRDLARRY